MNALASAMSREVNGTGVDWAGRVFTWYFVWLPRAPTRLDGRRDILESATSWDRCPTHQAPATPCVGSEQDLFVLISKKKKKKKKKKNARQTY